MEIVQVGVMGKRTLPIETASPQTLEKASTWLAVELSLLLRRNIQPILTRLDAHRDTSDRCIVLGEENGDGPSFAICAGSDPSTRFSIREYGLVIASDESVQTVYVLPDFRVRLQRALRQKQP